jgi:hypothetical protein
MVLLSSLSLLPIGPSSPAGGKELYGLVVRTLTAVRVFTVGAFQNRIINGWKVILHSLSLRIVYFLLPLCWPIIKLALGPAAAVAVAVVTVIVCAAILAL